MSQVSMKVGNARLLALAAFLRKLPRKRFNYAMWAGEDFTEKSCGTVGCALGWAASMPKFRRLGLRIDATGIPVYGPTLDNIGASAGMEIFGLDFSEAAYLFHPGDEAEENATPKYVARKIERFVAKRIKAAKAAKAAA